MFFNTDNQQTIVNSALDDYLYKWIEAFLIDQRARGNAIGTYNFYRENLKNFLNFCDFQVIKQISQITPDIIRQYLLFLEEKKHNPGGRHAAFRTVRAFLYWFENEAEPENWSNPIRKVKAPKVPIEPLEPVSFNTITQMISTCIPNTFTGDRDKAVLLFYLDTGVRAQEGLSIDLPDLNLINGEVLIRHGKGNKPRYVFFGKKTRQALRKYLYNRKDNKTALWVTRPQVGSERLSYYGLREIIRRRAKDARVEVPGIHDFRRAFALSMLQSGTDVFTLSKLMGHEGITVLQRYLKQTKQDIELAHRKASPVENGLYRNNSIL